MDILAKIKAAFRRTGQQGELFPGVRLIPASENPFGVDIWDCRAFTRNMVSTTASAEIAQRYVQLRGFRGDEYQGQIPPNARVVSCLLTYPLSPKPANGPLFKSKEMEDKWDVYLFDDALYFARSWTGELSFKAQAHYEAGALHITALVVAGDQDPTFAPQVVDYLMKSHVLRREVLHPLPERLPATPQSIALFSFSLFGRRCSYGTYANTILLRSFEPSP